MTQMVSGRIGRLRATMTGPVISPGDPDFALYRVTAAGSLVALPGR